MDRRRLRRPPRVVTSTRRRLGVGRCAWRGTMLGCEPALPGVAFFDFDHGQTGVAPNAIELHPILGFTCLTGVERRRSLGPEHWRFNRATAGGRESVTPLRPRGFGY